MLGPMSPGRALIAIAALGAALAVPGDGAAKGKRRGKVVRVERSPHGSAGTPRICQYRTDGGGTCWGKPPKVGEVGTVIDEVGIRATARVQRVTAQPDSCGNDTWYEIMTTVEAGDIAQLSGSPQFIVDWATPARTRAMINNGQIVIPSGRLGESLMTALDHDSDDLPDLIFTYYTCDPGGNLVTTGPGGAYCFVYYERESGSYAELRQDIVKTCY